MKKTISYLHAKKHNRQKISVLTSYDYPTTKILEEVGVDMIILGDSVGTNMLGYQDETEVTLEDMIHHTKAVCRAKENIFLVTDLPYNTYQTPGMAVENARRITAAGADAVKFEGGRIDILQALKSEGILVMCHLGLNPQHDQDRMRSGKISKGKQFSEAIELIQAAKNLESAGADLLILEKIPGKLAKIITGNVNIPTIGIGAGKDCDGQVLIIHDLLGLNDKKYKHAPRYFDMKSMVKDVIGRYQDEVAEGIFPALEHTNIIKESELSLVQAWCMEHEMDI